MSVMSAMSVMSVMSDITDITERASRRVFPLEVAICSASTRQVNSAPDTLTFDQTSKLWTR